MLLNMETTNEIALYVDHEERTVAIGIPCAALLGSAPGVNPNAIRLLAAVGREMSWSDDLVPTETIAIGLE